MIKGQRLTLRAIERDDLPRYVAWLNDPEVNQYLKPTTPFNLEDEVDWYENQRKDDTCLNLAMVITETGQHIGSIGLMHIDRRDQGAELGIAIGDKTQWHKGYGREAIHLLLDFTFNTFNLHRVFLRVDANHSGAIRCYTECGFVKEGRLRENVFRQGKFQDQLVMSVLRPEYYPPTHPNGVSS
jgi:RimJ/RimL family protein N-acetyltransferase